MTPLENLLRNNSSLFPFSPIPLHFSLCSVFPMSCMSPVISFGNHPEFANDKASPHRRPMRQNHTTEDELVIPWTMVLVGVPLMALKMWREFGKTLVFSSSGQILRHRNTTLPKCHAPNDVSQWHLSPNGHCSPEWWCAQGAWLWRFAKGLCQLN